MNRHPLQSRGAGQAERRLPDEAVVRYCNTLAVRSAAFRRVIGEEQLAGRLSRVAAAATTAFLDDLRATVMVMALKHGRQLLDAEPVPLTIDPTESGMPTFKDFWQLHEDHAQAQVRLTELPDHAALVQQALEALYNGRRPAREQILWLQRAYMERLAATPVIADFRVGTPVALTEGRGDHPFAVSWTSIVRSLNLFECTTLQFIERGGWHVSGGTEKLYTLVQSLEGGRHNPAEMLGLCNDVAWIVPQAIERVVIGPYHHEWTENDSLVKRAFAAAPDDAWMLRCSIERVAATRPAARSTWDKLLGHEPMEIGPVIRSVAMLVPLPIKQQLGDADEDNNPATVYGLSSAGDLIQ